MSCRGGRGRGRGQVRFKPEPFVIFPEITLPDPKSIPLDSELDKLDSIDFKSPYFLIFRPDNFPKELLGDTPRERPVKRAKLNQEADLKKLDVFEKLEAKCKAEVKEEKEQEGEDDEDEVEESQGEESDNGDYDQNQDFDDDDDDYNQADDGDQFEELY